MVEHALRGISLQVWLRGALVVFVLFTLGLVPPSTGGVTCWVIAILYALVAAGVAVMDSPGRRRSRPLRLACVVYRRRRAQRAVDVYRSGSAGRLDGRHTAAWLLRHPALGCCPVAALGLPERRRPDDGVLSGLMHRDAGRERRAFTGADHAVVRHCLPIGRCRVALRDPALPRADDRSARGGPIEPAG